ncbi:MAG: oligosaccharide flippase family protein, partial [Acetanaerobacterium sp.]
LILLLGAKDRIPRPNRASIRAAAKRHRDFPRYTMPGTLATTLSYNLVSYFLKAFFLPAQLGYYSLINQALSAPLTVISGAVGNVYLKRSSDEASASRLNARTFTAVTRTLFVLSVPIFAVLFVFATPIIRIFLGEQWLPAAGMVRALIPMFLVRFVVTPVSFSAIVAGRQGGAMVWQFTLLGASVIPAVVQMIAPLSINRYLALLSVLVAVCYFVFYLYCKRLLTKRQDDEYPAASS